MNARTPSPLSRMLSATGLAAICTATVLTLATPGAGQAGEWDVDGIEELVPREETSAERETWRALGSPSSARVLADPPPAAPIRNCAEWEPVTGVLVRYPLGLPYTLLRDIADSVTLHVVVSSSLQTTAETNLTNNGVNMGNVEFLVEPNNSIWTRDYGPWFVFDGNDDLTIIDHVYNRPTRPNDNLIPVRFGQQQGIPVVSHDMLHTGGNYMTDGAHISSSTELVYNEAGSQQGMSEEDVNTLMGNYYGVAEYSVLDYIENGGIHHIDTWAKFLDEENVLVKDVWQSHPTYGPLNQRATLLASLPASTGRNYQVERVYCYNIGGNSPASYTNSLIVNDQIMVPLFGSTTDDNNALAVYEAAAPGYQVRGYFYGGWISDDALHCRTKGVMDVGMLRVSHVPTVTDQSGAVTMAAKIQAHSEAAITSAELIYRHGTGSWQTVVLTLDGANQFSGQIPAPASTETCDYYLHAADASGRTEGMPRTEPDHFYSFVHSPDVATVPDAIGSPPLAQNFPNPFHDATTFSFELAEPERVDLAVFDAQGRRVRLLVNEIRRAGAHQIIWDGHDDKGEPLPAGVYLYRLRAAGLEYSRPAQLMR